MAKSHFISRALVSRWADTMEMEKALSENQRNRFASPLRQSFDGAFARLNAVEIIGCNAEAMIELSALVDHEIEKRKVERSRLAKHRIEARAAATKEALEDALYS